MSARSRDVGHLPVSSTQLRISANSPRRKGGRAFNSATLHPSMPEALLVDCLLRVARRDSEVSGASVIGAEEK